MEKILCFIYSTAFVSISIQKNTRKCYQIRKHHYYLCMLGLLIISGLLLCLTIFLKFPATHTQSFCFFFKERTEAQDSTRDNKRGTRQLMSSSWINFYNIERTGRCDYKTTVSNLKEIRNWEEGQGTGDRNMLFQFSKMRKMCILKSRKQWI